MVNIFDKVNGELVLPNGVRLRRGMTADEVIRAPGLTFVREIDVNTGWVYRTTSEFFIRDHPVQFGLGFNHDRLLTAAFGFNDLAHLPASERRQQHDRFLAAEMGSPSRITPAATSYVFPWGTVESTFDPRTGQTDIITRWTAE